jgi:hypothetical protein
MSPDLAEIERRMQPGAWDTAGFLTRGTSLEAVLAADRETLARRCVDAATLGDRLIKVLAGAGAGSDRGRPVRVGPHEVEILRQRGFITCPWASEEFEACSVGSGARPTANRFSVLHRPSGRRLEGFELSAHLMRDHGFFGGPGSRFRLDPLDVAAVLLADAGS